jgi:4-hydroxyphenylpyruvate dioxygenase
LSLTAKAVLTEFVAMLTSIATVSISGTLDRKLAAIAEAGYQGVEIFENDLLGFDGTAADAGRMIADFGLICTCYQPFRDFEGLTGSLRQRAFDRAEYKFDVMQALGARLMLVCSSVHPEALGEPERAVEDFRLLAQRAASRGYALVTRRWPGAASSTTIARPGTSCGASIIPPWA